MDGVQRSRGWHVDGEVDLRIYANPACLSINPLPGQKAARKKLLWNTASVRSRMVDFMMPYNMAETLTYILREFLY